MEPSLFSLHQHPCAVVKRKAYKTIQRIQSLPPNDWIEIYPRSLFLFLGIRLPSSIFSDRLVHWNTVVKQIFQIPSQKRAESCVGKPAISVFASALYLFLSILIFKIYCNF